MHAVVRAMTMATNTAARPRVARTERSAPSRLQLWHDDASARTLASATAAVHAGTLTHTHLAASGACNCEASSFHLIGYLRKFG